MRKNNHNFFRMAAVAAALTISMGAALAQSTSNYYEVEAGDTLYGISQRYGISVEQLRAANPQIGDDNVISIGQRLVIPSPDAVIETEETVTTTTRTSQTPGSTTTTTTTVIEERPYTFNDTFTEGDMLASFSVGMGSVKKRGEMMDETKNVFTQQLSLDYCFEDDVMGGSALGVGLMVNNAVGGKYEFSDQSTHQRYRRNDLSVLATLSLHHQFVDRLDTYAKAGLGVGVLNDHAWVSDLQPVPGFGENSIHRVNGAFAAAFLIGARYYVADYWGAFVEIGLPTGSFNKDFGSSVSLLNVGVSYKL